MQWSVAWAALWWIGVSFRCIRVVYRGNDRAVSRDRSANAVVTMLVAAEIDQALPGARDPPSHDEVVEQVLRRRGVDRYCRGAVLHTSPGTPLTLPWARRYDQYPTDHQAHNDPVASTLQFSVVLALSILVMLLILWRR